MSRSPQSMRSSLDTFITPRFVRRTMLEQDAPMPSLDVRADGLPVSVGAEVDRSLEAGSSTTSRWIGLAFLIVLFWVSGDGPVSLAAFLGGLLISDLGVYVIMRVAGAVDTRILILPFLKEEVTPNASAGRQSLVLLSGPTLLVVVSVVAWLVTALFDRDLARALALPIVGLALFRLLPLKPYTGWRLLNLLLFSRSKNLESVVAVATSLVLAGLAAAMQAWVLVGIALLQIAGVPATRRRRDVADRLKADTSEPFVPLEQMSPGLRARVLSLTWAEFQRELGEVGNKNPKNCAQVLLNHARDIVATAGRVHPSAGLTVLVLGIYVALSAYFVGAIVLLFAFSR